MILSENYVIYTIYGSYIAYNRILFISECFALKVLLEDLVDKLNISVVTTDRSGSIKALMR
jgi:hypothetical protein